MEKTVPTLRLCEGDLDMTALRRALMNTGMPFSVLCDGSILEGFPAGGDIDQDLAAYVPAISPQHLGDLSLLDELGISVPCFAGAMYHGITSPAMVVAMGKAGMMGFLGSGGLRPEAIHSALGTIRDGIGQHPFGCNLLHSPGDPCLEDATVDALIAHGVRNVSAAAYIQLTLPLTRYRTHGISLTPEGVPVCPNRVFGKISRVEVAQRFFSPPSEEHLRTLVGTGHLTETQAKIAASIPMADTLTAEADSGGHTDNRPFVTMIPSIMEVRDRAQARYGPSVTLRVGAAGGLSTPGSAAAAFSMGAAYILTGSINQSCLEAATSAQAKAMLCNAGQADVMLAPAADMFEMGAKVQVLKKGTMFPMKAARLSELFRTCGGLDDIPADTRSGLEKTLFRQPIDQILCETRDYFSRRNPGLFGQAMEDPKQLMALVFKWYLGKSAYWAEEGASDRVIDYQIQCGPAMGAFNEWVADTFLEKAENRDVVTVNLNIMYGAMVLTRGHILRSQGIRLAPGSLRIIPTDATAIHARMYGKA